MKLSDLKTGMVVKLRNGWVGLVLIGCDFPLAGKSLNNCLIGRELDDYSFLSDYNEDMLCNDECFNDDFNKDFDIMFVYQPAHPFDVMRVFKEIETNTDIADCIYNREWEER